MKHVLFGTEDSLVNEVVTKNGQIIGKAVSHGDSFPFTSTGEIGLLKLSKGQPFSTSYGDYLSIKAFEDDEEIDLNKLVYVYDKDRKKRKGRISSIRTTVSVRMPHPNNVLIYNAIRIRSIDPEIPFAKHGDSGAPVIDKKGRIVGIVISGNENFVYLVPVDDFLRENNLSLSEQFEDKISSEGSTHPFANNINLLANANRAALLDQPVDMGEMPAELRELDIMGAKDDK